MADGDDSPGSNVDPLAFLTSTSEMGRRTREFDWSQTPLGPASQWPQSLKTAVRIMLDSRYAMWLGWGPDFTFFYNDAYASMTLGPKHPWALGRSAREVWSEIWDDIGPRAESVIRTGKATWDEGLLLFLERQGFREESYHTFSYSPVPDDENRVGGMLCVVTEDTARTIGERRLKILRELAARTTTEAKTTHEACRTAAATLSRCPEDVPFALLYLLDNEGSRATLVGRTGLRADSAPCPSHVDLESANLPWPFRDVLENRKPVLVKDLSARFGPLPAGPWPESAELALVLPLAKQGQARLAGILIAGISPRLVYTDEYRGFLELLAGQISAAIANARVYEEERRRAEALAELDRAKTTFFSNISHEFRTPLTLMIGPLEELLEGDNTQLPGTTREQLDLINRNARRLLRLVNSLLDFSRIEAGRVRATFRLTDISAYTSELASVFRSAIERAGLRLVVDCPHISQPCYVDREMWEKIVLNLLSNAFKFTFAGEIRVILRQVAQAFEMTVEDTGIGIPDDQMPRLFERFHRIENARGRTHEGSGIGLALVQELVKIHDGSIHAASIHGRGTSFTISIPVGKNHLPPDQIGENQDFTPGNIASPYVEEAFRWLPGGDGERLPESTGELIYGESVPGPASLATDQTRPLVLIADDNADMRQYVVRLLDPLVRTVSAADGEAALAVARETPPDLVLTDVMMPRLDGFGLLHHLRTNPDTQSIPVIMLSARAGEESRVEGMEAGADDYLVKPFSARELLARVSAHLQMSRMRQQASESLRESEERFRKLADDVPLFIWLADPDGNVTYANRSLLDYAGYADLATFPPRAWETMVAPEDVDTIQQAFRTVLVQREPFSCEVRYRKGGTGDYRWILVKGIPRLVAGEFAGVMGTGIDIHDQRLATEAVRESESRYRSLFESMDEGYCIIKVVFDELGSPSDYQFIEINPAFERQTGIKNAQGRWMREISPLHEPHWYEIYGRIAKTGETLRFEYPAAALGRWFDVCAFRIGPPELNHVGIIFNDISLRRHTMEALRHSEERLQMAVSAGDIGTFDWNVSNELVVIDERMAHWMGIEVIEARNGITIDRLLTRVHLDDQKRISDLVSKTPSTENRISTECRVVDADGQVRWVEANAVIERDQNRRPHRLTGTLFNITERKLAEEALQESARRKDEFLATLAHELRNPLAPIRNGLQIMQIAQGDSDAFEQARTMMERQLVHMIRLIDDLLDLSRISRGKIQLRKERLELAKIVQHAVETSRPAIEQAGHELTINFPPEPIYVDADLSRMSQVFTNLLDNAAKYTERGGRVMLIVERRENRAVVTVEDNGVGIPAAMLPRVFEMFTQVDRSLEKARGGLGIGLSLVKQLVEMHGGEVEAHSAGQGQGSQFVVQLPIVQSLSGTRRDDRVETSVAALPSRRILVADDNRDAASSLAMMLRIMGSEIQIAHDGLEAIQIAETFRPDIALLDIGMPRLNGYETARRIREQPWGRDMILIAQTGWGQDEDKRQSEQAGFDYHLVKPVDPAALERLLATVRTQKS